MRNEFLIEVARELKEAGYRVFGYSSERTGSEWLSIITPRSWIMIEKSEWFGWDIIYKYKPDKDFGGGVIIEKGIHKINSQTIVNAEKVGQDYYTTKRSRVRNFYDKGYHYETRILRPRLYLEDFEAYEAFKQSYFYKEYVEL